MSRIIFILVLLVVGYVLLKSWQRRHDLPPQNKKTTGKILNNTRMVRCLHCNLHVPEHEAISQGGKHFCSLEHATQHLTKS
jgi:uncharacterized protein